MKRSIGLAAALLGLAGLGAGAAFGVHAQGIRKVSARTGTEASVDERWRESLDAFAAADKLAAPHLGGVLFVGSSSIRLWSDLEAQFSDRAGVLKRGFGGSRMADVARYADRLVVAYEPRVVVVYAGDNDLAEGRTPEDVLDSFTEFVDTVHAALPQTRIAYVSIKPSPLRATLMPQALRTNELIRTYAESRSGLDYVDIYSKMLDADGKPRVDLFMADSLHLNAAGYAVWKAAISEHLRTMEAPMSPSAAPVVATALRSAGP